MQPPDRRDAAEISLTCGAGRRARGNFMPGVTTHNARGGLTGA